MGVLRRLFFIVEVNFSKDLGPKTANVCIHYNPDPVLIDAGSMTSDLLKPLSSKTRPLCSSIFLLSATDLIQFYKSHWR